MRHHHVGQNMILHHGGQGIHRHHVGQSIPRHHGQEADTAPGICRAEMPKEFSATRVIAEYVPRNVQAVAIHFMPTKVEIDGVYG